MLFGVNIFRVPLSNLFLLKEKPQTSEKQRQEKRHFQISVPDVRPLASWTQLKHRAPDTGALAIFTFMYGIL